MFNKLTVSAAALAAFGMAGAASAQETVDIDVTVQEIAVLNVISNAASAVVDSTGDFFMPNPSSSGSDLSNFAQLQLQTNYTVDSLQIDFPRRANSQFNGGSSVSTYFGEATCRAGSDCDGVTTAIGVWPAAGEISGGSTAGQALFNHDGTNTPLMLQGPHREDCANLGECDFENGQYDIAVGVSANWDRTFTGEPLFASPGIYDITLTATIMP